MPGLQPVSAKHHRQLNPFGKSNGWNVNEARNRIIGEIKVNFQSIWADDEGEELLTVAQDGYVMKYSHRGGAQLIARHQMRVQLIEGSVEGISTPPAERTNQANRQVLLLHLSLVGNRSQPLHSDSTQILSGADASNAPNRCVDVFRWHKWGLFAQMLNLLSAPAHAGAASPQIRCLLHGILPLESEDIPHVRHRLDDSYLDRGHSRAHRWTLPRFRADPLCRLVSNEFNYFDIVHPLAVVHLGSENELLASGIDAFHSSQCVKLSFRWTAAAANSRRRYKRVPIYKLRSFDCFGRWRWLRVCVRTRGYAISTALSIQSARASDSQVFGHKNPTRTPSETNGLFGLQRTIATNVHQRQR